MRIYHGSIEVVNNPTIRQSNRTLDYGTGFYTTTSLEQAKAWVKRKMSGQGLTHGYLNVYDFDFSAMRKLNCLSFDKPTEQWLDFVMANPLGKTLRMVMTSCMALLPTIVYMPLLPYTKVVC